MIAIILINFVAESNRFLEPLEVAHGAPALDGTQFEHSCSKTLPRRLPGEAEENHEHVQRKQQLSV